MIDRLSSINTILGILKFIGSPHEFLVISCICKSWMTILDIKDGELWSCMASEFQILMHSPNPKKSLRSTSNYKNVIYAYVCANSLS